MKRREKNVEQIVDAHLGLFGTLSEQEMAQAEERALPRLRSESAFATKAPAVDKASIRPWWGWRLGLMGAAVAVALVVVIQIPAIRTFIWGIDAHAVVESADGGLYRVSGGGVLHAGERIEAGEAIRTNGGVGTLLKLADGSGIEMRSKSELALERADDGVRIRLDKGGVIVNAAKQHGHLYVQTKDVLVSVVGTVFLVNAEEEGSRVAVIEGEVRVQQQGETEKRLRPGEQVRTNPKMESQPVQLEVSWSKNAVEHILLLEQLAVISTVRQNSTEPRLAFEEASIRSARADTGRGRGATGVPTGCDGSYQFQFDPRRFAVFGTTLQVLVTWAYGTGPLDYQNCKNMSGQNRISGGPGWMRSELWDVQAVIPEGALNYTPEQVKKGEAPKLRMMLQALLANRFQLVLRSETKEVSAYVLTADKGAPRLTLSAELDTPQFREELVNPKQPGVVPERGAIFVKNAPIADLIPLLEQDIGQPVLDQTGLTGQYSFFIEYTPLYRLNNGGTPFSGPAIFKALQEQVGLRLSETKTTVTTWRIEGAEKPSEN